MGIIESIVAGVAVFVITGACAKFCPILFGKWTERKTRRSRRSSEEHQEHPDTIAVPIRTTRKKRNGPDGTQ